MVVHHKNAQLVERKGSDAVCELIVRSRLLVLMIIAQTVKCYLSQANLGFPVREGVYGGGGGGDEVGSQQFCLSISFLKQLSEKKKKEKGKNALA